MFNIKTTKLNGEYNISETKYFTIAQFEQLYNKGHIIIAIFDYGVLTLLSPCLTKMIPNT